MLRKDRVKILLDTPKFLAWCSAGSNLVSIHEIETDNEYANFEGARLPHNKDQSKNCSKSILIRVPTFRLVLFSRQGDT